jgi:hypothetical protein
MLLYSFLLGMVSIPFFMGFLPHIFEHGIFSHGHHNGFSFRFDSDFPWDWKIWPLGISGLAHLLLTGINIIYTILGTIRTNEGQDFNYPLSIKFIK